MQTQKLRPVLQAVLAALLFGISTPISKLLLNNIEPLPLAAFLYLGSGMGLGIYVLVRKLLIKSEPREAPLTKKEFPWLLGVVVFGGIIAPVVLMLSLDASPASTASLLLNFECVATSVIAAIVFKESLGKRIIVSIVLITAASIVLSWDAGNKWGVSLGSLGVLVTCICWGIDNNFTRNISLKNPYTIVIIKGLGAGLFSLLLALGLGSAVPDIKSILAAMLLGFFSYGFSIVLFVLAMRNLGSARTSAIFGAAPFIGALLSFFIFKSVPNREFLISLPLMALGIVMIIIDNHEHRHTHERLEHNHKHHHPDEHHCHAHEGEGSVDQITHTHLHTHENVEHEHKHYPDIHHRH